MNPDETPKPYQVGKSTFFNGPAINPEKRWRLPILGLFGKGAKNDVAFLILAIENNDDGLIDLLLKKARLGRLEDYFITKSFKMVLKAAVMEGKTQLLKEQLLPMWDAKVPCLSLEPKELLNVINGTIVSDDQKMAAKALLCTAFQHDDQLSGKLAKIYNMHPFEKESTGGMPSTVTEITNLSYNNA